MTNPISFHLMTFLNTIQKLHQLEEKNPYFFACASLHVQKHVNKWAHQFCRFGLADDTQERAHKLDQSS